MEGEYDERLDEMMGLLRKTADGVDDLRVEVRDLRSGHRDATAGFEDVAKVVIKETQRITGLEQRFDALEGEAH
jgi:hypothetical protein